MNIWQVLVSSPSDVSEERESLSRVVETVNLALEAGGKPIRLQLRKWETDVPPGLHKQGGQGQIESKLYFGDCDILIGIFWKRFGTPVLGSMSGTEREILQGRDGWRSKRRPKVMVFFSTAPPPTRTLEEVEQLRKVIEFKEALTSAPRITGYRQLTHDGLPKAGPLLTDGHFIYFTERVSHAENSEARLAAVTIVGGEVLYPAAPVQPGILLDINASTGDRLYQSDPRSDTAATFLWRSKEGSLEPAGIDVAEFSMSPDGHSVTSGDGRSTLRIRDVGPSPNVRTILVPGHARDPRWSPDGSRVRFGVDDPSTSDDRVELWEVHRDGTGLRKLGISVPHGKSLGAEGWTADGRYFIFTEYGIGDRTSNLWIERDDSRGAARAKPVRLTNAPMDFRSAVVAQNDSTIFSIGSKSRNELVRFDMQQRSFAPLWEGFPAIDASFSNNGKWAAFGRYPDFILWVSRADGSERRQITWPPLEGHQPHWSPDASRIAFMGRMPGKPWRIYVVAASGGFPQEIKPDDPFDQGVPSWSGDGRSLVFGERREKKPDTEMVIRVLNLGSRTETVLPGSEGKWSPRWSPDGRYILATTTDFKTLNLFNCKSQTWRLLVSAWPIDDAAWSLDSKFIHFTADTNGGKALFRVRVADGSVEQLALQPELEYSWSGVAPDGSPLTLRSVKIEEIYALELRLP